MFVVSSLSKLSRRLVFSCPLDSTPVRSGPSWQTKTPWPNGRSVRQGSSFLQLACLVHTSVSMYFLVQSLRKTTPEWRRLADCFPVLALMWSFMSGWLLFPQPLPSPPPIGCRGIPLERLFPHGVQRVFAVNFHGMGELDHTLFLLSVVFLVFCYVLFCCFFVFTIILHALYSI